MDETCRPVVFEESGVLFFGEQEDDRRVQVLQILSVAKVQFLQSRQEILLDRLPEGFVKKRLVKPSGPGAFSDGISMMVFRTFSSVNGTSSCEVEPNMSWFGRTHDVVAVRVDQVYHVVLNRGKHALMLQG